jgi:hypothetical protein
MIARGGTSNARESCDQTKTFCMIARGGTSNARESDTARHDAKRVPGIRQSGYLPANLKGL